SKKILVAMSGGVDSSVAALLLKKQGYQVVGVTLCLHSLPGREAASSDKKAVEDAAKVCEHLGIPHMVLDFSSLFRKKVIIPFLEEYKKGYTPNPCVVCNRFIKFGELLERALSMGFDALATGHYARLVEEKGKIFLAKPRDRAKDQTYFLYRLQQKSLSHLVFPLAEFTKGEVRRIAREHSLPVAHKPQSQDVCFGDYQSMIQENIAPRPGLIVDLEGRVLGKHRGIPFYTVGQRRGLGVSSAERLYVVNIIPQRNQIVVGRREALQAKGLVARELNWFVSEVPEQALAKIRYTHQERACRIKLLDSDTIEVIFAEPVEMVTPGQSVVFYKGELVLGGGIIKEAIRYERPDSKNSGAENKEKRCDTCP
ncbi:MAG: tRNA 2-thiouridine(34) synthase MnmA, partial [Candidatus Atribacteria bacterium]|nr:tRNA 2-thiouridine(34) synthase MnmA [Candidatus Atribacteria bacterium]MCD6350074.1 tRNA 2-thiouridine(34) synthase MnmA [Candidatus Atribacteria bacterium]